MDASEEESGRLVGHMDCYCCGIQSHTPGRTLKTVEHSLLHQRVHGESVPHKDPDVSERLSFIPPLHDWLHVSNLFVVYD